jgi:hypothetical protein
MEVLPPKTRQRVNLILQATHSRVCLEAQHVWTHMLSTPYAAAAMSTNMKDESLSEAPDSPTIHALQSPSHLLHNTLPFIYSHIANLSQTN